LKGRSRFGFNTAKVEYNTSMSKVCTIFTPGGEHQILTLDYMDVTVGDNSIGGALYMVAISASRWNAVIKAFYDKLRAAGKPHP